MEPSTPSERDPIVDRAAQAHATQAQAEQAVEQDSKQAGKQSGAAQARPYQDGAILSRPEPSSTAQSISRQATSPDQPSEPHHHSQPSFKGGRGSWRARIEPHHHPQPHYRWGRVKHGRIPALRVAVPLGLLASLAIGVLQVPNNSDGPQRWLAVAIFVVCISPCTIALSWVLCVDRSTLPGAVRDTENSVENTWYSKAAVDAFHLILAGCGIGAWVASGWNAAVSWTLVGVAVALAVVFLVSYLIRRAR